MGNNFSISKSANATLQSLQGGTKLIMGCVKLHSASCIVETERRPWYLYSFPSLTKSVLSTSPNWFVIAIVNLFGTSSLYSSHRSQFSGLKLSVTPKSNTFLSFMLVTIELISGVQLLSSSSSSSSWQLSPKMMVWSSSSPSPFSSVHSFHQWLW